MLPTAAFAQIKYSKLGVESKAIKARAEFVCHERMYSTLRRFDLRRWMAIRVDILGALALFLAALMAVVAGRASPGTVRKHQDSAPSSVVRCFPSSGDRC